MARFSESVVEEAALAWLEPAGWQIRNGAEIAPGELAAGREDYGEWGQSCNFPANGRSTSHFPLSGVLRL